MSPKFYSDDAAADSVGEAAIEDGAVTTAKIAAGNVTTDRIADTAVTAAKIADDNVDAAEIATDAVRAAEIQADAVGSSEIATDAVDAAEIATDAVRAAEIQASAVGTSEVADNTLTASDLAADSVDSSEIAANAVGTSEIATDGVDSAEIKDGAVTAAEIATGAITAADAAADMATQAELDAVVAGAVTDGSLSVSKWAAAQSFSANGSILASGGRDVRYTGSTASQVLGLPAAASGLEFLVHNLATVPVTIDGNGAEYIGHASNANVVLAPGAKVLLVAAGTGSWYPVWDVGEQVSGGFDTRSTDANAGDALTFTINGDGVTPIKIEFTADCARNSTSGQDLTAQIRDGASGAGTLFRQSLATAGGANYSVNLNTQVVLAPFTGSKTLYLAIASTGGTPTLKAAATSPATMRATWAPGQYTADP